MHMRGARLGWYQPLREEISALPGERKISARRMHRDPAVRGSGFDRGDIFLSSTASRQELFVDGGDRQSPGMIGFICVRQLEQFLLCDIGVGERAIFFEFHQACLVSAVVMGGTRITVFEAFAIEDFAAGHVMSELDFCDGRTAARPDGRVARLYTYPRGDVLAKCPPALGRQMCAYASDARKAASEVARQMPIREAFF
jgi:hypothetical protein